MRVGTLQAGLATAVLDLGFEEVKSRQAEACPTGVYSERFGGPRASRTLRASVSCVNGFCNTRTALPRTPCFSMASSVYLCLSNGDPPNAFPKPPAIFLTM